MAQAHAKLIANTLPEALLPRSPCTWLPRLSFSPRKTSGNGICVWCFSPPTSLCLAGEGQLASAQQEHLGFHFSKESIPISTAPRIVTPLSGLHYCPLRLQNKKFSNIHSPRQGPLCSCKTLSHSHTHPTLPPSGATQPSSNTPSLLCLCDLGISLP